MGKAGKIPMVMHIFERGIPQDMLKINKGKSFVSIIFIFHMKVSTYATQTCSKLTIEYSTSMYSIVLSLSNSSEKCYAMY